MGLPRNNLDFARDTLRAELLAWRAIYVEEPPVVMHHFHARVISMPPGQNLSLSGTDFGFTGRMSDVWESKVGDALEFTVRNISAEEREAEAVCAIVRQIGTKLSSR